ncbi:MAG TPA: hypothetical protein VK888_05165 [Anaerolineales bacterium]|nr:hypothetical protein [Anaerolineales bacterium]
MSRLVNVLFALLLLAALVIALDPETRQKAIAAVRDLEPALSELDDRIVANVPALDPSEEDVTPSPTRTPVPTPVVDEDRQIPVTGDEDSSDEPFIQVNWDALGDALRNLWERLQNVEIDLDPNDNR